MFIRDLEFIEIFNQKSVANNLMITGGASASVTVTTSTSDGSSFASAEVFTSGDFSRANTSTRAKVIVRGSNGHSVGYNTGYSVAYGVGYGVDRYDPVVSSMNSSRSTITMT